MAVVTGEGWVQSSMNSGYGSPELRFHKDDCGRGMPGCAVELRNSAYPEGPSLHYTRDEWLAFCEGVRAGEFDAL